MVEGVVKFSPIFPNSSKLSCQWKPLTSPPSTYHLISRPSQGILIELFWSGVEFPTYFPYSSLEKQGLGEGDREPPRKLPENGFRDWLSRCLLARSLNNETLSDRDLKATGSVMSRRARNRDLTWPDKPKNSNLTFSKNVERFPPKRVRGTPSTIYFKICICDVRPLPFYGRWRWWRVRKNFPL